MTDPYKILDVDYEASDSEIKKAYYALARKYHPDNFASDPKMGELANRKMREINAAYEQITADRERGIRGKAAYQAPPPPPKTHTEAPKRSAASDAPRSTARSARGANEMPPNFMGYAYIRTMINGESYAAAYGELCRVPERLRGAEWHYLAGLAHIGLHHLHDAIVELNVACRKDRRNAEYRKAREELLRHGASFGAAYGRDTRKKETENAPKGKKRGFLKRGLLRLFGLDDGEF